MMMTMRSATIGMASTFFSISYYTRILRFNLVKRVMYYDFQLIVYNELAFIRFYISENLKGYSLDQRLNI